jgi:uncharacterized iron-regulated protein
MLILLSLLFTGIEDFSGTDITILASSGDTLSISQFIDNLTSYDAVFVGEQHDAKPAHSAELAILTALAERDSALVLALEMFERDAQETLDAYLAGEITEDSFLAYSRPWPNYSTDYRPLVEFARSRNIPVVAANVPRRAAAAVASAAEVSPEVLGVDSIWLPDTLYLDSDEYYRRFAETMKAMPHQGPMGGMNVGALYRAQVLKDAVMAASLDPYLERRVLFFCGRFHSDYHLGIPYQLERRHPDLRIAVISLKSAEEELTEEERARIADFTWIYP